MNCELNDFVYIVSYDLKELLRGISINVDFLKCEYLIDVVVCCVEWMGKLVC